MNDASATGWAKTWLLPPGLTRLLQDAKVDRGVGGEGRRLLAANRGLRGRHAGQRGFVLCSGPSIKTQDLRSLRGETCLGVSNFFVHPHYAAIAPRYHCIAPLHPPFTDADGTRWFREMEGPLTGRELFLSLSDRHLVMKGALFAGTQVHYFATGKNWPDAPGELSLTAPLPKTQSVSILALLIMLHLGFSEIYLVGADHTSVNFQTGQYAYNHFYTGTRANALGEMSTPPDLEREFRSYVALWEQYKAVRDLASLRGVKIVNATRGGVLDLFPRVNLEEVVGGTR